MMNRARIELLLKTLATHMRERRRYLGLTQEQLAERSGLSPNYIAKLELETRVPSMSALVALSEALEVNVSELLSEAEGQGWMDATEDIVRAVRSLQPEDTQFALDNLRSVVGHIRRLRGSR